MKENTNSSKPSWKAGNPPPNRHTKNRTFVLCTISKDRICHIISSRVEYSEQVWFEYDVLKVIFENSANSHIFSEEDILTDKIEPVISNGVATIGGGYTIQKGIVTLSLS